MWVFTSRQIEYNIPNVLIELADTPDFKQNNRDCAFTPYILRTLLHLAPYTPYLLSKYLKIKANLKTIHKCRYSLASKVSTFGWGIDISSSSSPILASPLKISLMLTAIMSPVHKEIPIRTTYSSVTC